MIQETPRKWGKRILILFVFLFLFFCICLIYGYYEARHITLKKFTFNHEDIPSSFVGKKIIFVADIHCNQYFDGQCVAALVQTINEQHPDIVILGGDYIESDSIYQQQFFDEIAKIDNVKDVYAVLGNHDHWADAPLVWRRFEEIGINICDNLSYWVKIGNDSIKIGGVGDLWEDDQIIENTTQDVSDNDFCMLLSHNPAYIDQLQTNKIDFMLSGHNHGGQVTLFGLWAPVLPNTMNRSWFDTEQKYRYGWVDKEDVRMFVTAGVGMGATPIRFFAPPEIVEITLAK